MVYCSYSTDITKTDSLLSQLENTKEDTNKVIILNKLAYEIYGDDLQKALFYANKAFPLAEKLHFKKGMSAAYSIIGIIYQHQRNYKKALKFYALSINVLEELKNKKGVANAYNNIGITHFIHGNYSKALKSFFKALKIQEDIDDKAGMAKTYNSIGIIHSNQGNDSKTLEYYLKSLKILEELEDKQRMATLYNNIGIIHANQENDSLAMGFYFKAVQINQEFENKRGLAMNYNNIGDLYTQQENYSQALNYQEMALEIQELLTAKSEMLYSLAGIGEIYTKQHKSKKAIDYFNKCVTISLEVGNPKQLMDAYKGLSEAYSALNDYKNAYKYHLLFSGIKDSLFTEESHKQIAEMETKYQTEKKEQEIQVLAKENEIKKLQIAKEENLRYILIVGFSLILLISFLLYNRYRLKQKKERLEEKQDLLNQINQHQEALINAIVNAQEEERKRIAGELHDGLGGLLSTVKVNLDNVKNTYVSTKENDSKLLIKSISLVDEVCSDLRTISHNMMPGVLVKLGLVAAVNNFVDNVSETNVFNINFETVGLEDRMDGTIEIVLYRVIQETINNIIKHADAKSVNVQLVKHEKVLTVMIEDDGKGFDFEIIRKENGIGLKNIESRVKYLNGSVVFDSTPGRGTNVIIEIPIREYNFAN